MFKFWVCFWQFWLYFDFKKVFFLKIFVLIFFRCFFVVDIFEFCFENLNFWMKMLDVFFVVVILFILIDFFIFQLIFAFLKFVEIFKEKFSFSFFFFLKIFFVYFWFLKNLFAFLFDIFRYFLEILIFYFYFFSTSSCPFFYVLFIFSLQTCYKLRQTSFQNVIYSWHFRYISFPSFHF